MQSLTTKQFDAFLETHQVVVVVFSAEWCKPCQDFKKTLEDISSEYPQVRFALVDIESEAELSSDFGVRSVPTTAVFREHIALCIESGVMTKQALRDLIHQADALDMAQVHYSIAQQFLGA